MLHKHLETIVHLGSLLPFHQTWPLFLLAPYSLTRVIGRDGVERHKRHTFIRLTAPRSLWRDWQRMNIVALYICARTLHNHPLKKKMMRIFNHGDNSWLSHDPPVNWFLFHASRNLWMPNWMSASLRTFRNTRLGHARCRSSSKSTTLGLEKPISNRFYNNWVVGSKHHISCFIWWWATGSSCLSQKWVMLSYATSHPGNWSTFPTSWTGDCHVKGPFHWTVLGLKNVCQSSWMARLKLSKIVLTHFWSNPNPLPPNYGGYKGIPFHIWLGKLPGAYLTGVLYCLLEIRLFLGKRPKPTP